MAKKFDTKTEGLDAYVYMAKVFADSPWLHYGLWEPGERVVVPNVRQAQERYVEKLIGLFPPAPLAVLDVGGGTGEMAALLQSRGYEVDMLTPSSVQVEEARKKLAAERVHHCRFEEFSGEKKFDVVLFSESFQYVPLGDSLPRLEALLNEGGIVVIADCFRNDNFRKGELVPGGGHIFSEFVRGVEVNGLEIVGDVDVTEGVAPTMQIDQQFYRGFLAPVVKQISEGLARSRPIVHWFLARGFNIFTSKDTRNRLQERFKADYRSPENFKRVNTYRFLTLRAR
ncbi:MAG TPA: class I SAM-dependent methyltransferase [Devosia sp.]|nr:class I SAM-dependent methyltransferase [Devosia sp.]